MSAEWVLITEVRPEEGVDPSAVARRWAALPTPAAVLQRSVYAALDGSSVMELAALPSLDSLAALRPAWGGGWDALGAHLRSDFSRQVLRFVSAPKPVDGLLPATEFVQLRHVEVRPPAYQDYLAWRERTIFDVVRAAPEVEAFLAYHSVLSTEPGVMFIAGFSGDVDAYGNVFKSPRYQEIVRQAGQHYITGGERGLYTRIYRRVAAQGATA